MKRLLQSRFLKDSAILQASGAIVALSSLLGVVVVSWAIGSDQMGEYITAVSLYGLFFMVFNTGVMQAAVTQIASNLAQKRVEKIASWQAFLVKVYALAGIFLLVVGYFVLPPLGAAVGDSRHVGDMAWWLCASPLLELPRVVAATTFQASRRMSELARLELGTELGRLILVVIGALAIGDARGPLLGTLGATVVGSVIGVVLYRRIAHDPDTELPTPRVILAHVRDVPLRKGLRLGIRIGALRSIDALAGNILPPLFIQHAGRSIGFPHTDQWVSYFRIAQRVMQVPVIALQGISRTALPALSQIAGRRDDVAFERAFQRVTVGSGLITGVGVLVALLLVKLPVTWFLPPDFHGPVPQLCAILAIGYGILGFAVAFDSYYILTNQLNFGLRLAIASMLVTIPMVYWFCLISPATGAAWGMVVIHTWGGVHLAFIARYFRAGRGRGMFDEAAPVAAKATGEAGL
ncbi:lipopolysaccharide biosynthesis protein [Engelhardtia mirabilis]|uniref:Polysaccharide biosynthesis protein n=1 Tax=Engelhardtia mirabilis TaxID=2528011 RepID=A0A518BK81_9BACT|nr:Polysaccharide biosynthesis protein [Planctomycetes bacterium Pla133]QDV01710.1 Polysaccharide biosynthesis protein [Planctomycetes bacterium Pla86]